MTETTVPSGGTEPPSEGPYQDEILLRRTREESRRRRDDLVNWLEPMVLATRDEMP